MDIYIRDERVLVYIKEQIAAGHTQIKHEEIAEKFGCTRQTAWAIVQRLERNRLIVIDKAAKRGGYFYELPQESNGQCRTRAG